MSTTRYLALSAVLLASTQAKAGGLSLNDFGAKASGKGTAMVAVTDDPSAIYFNPANIAFLQGINIDLGAGAAMPKFAYTPLEGGATTKTKTTAVPLPFLSATYNAGGTKFGDFALGLGLYVPLGSGFEWPTGWAGDQQVRRIELQVFDINPTVAWRIGKRFAVGVGFNYMPSAVYLSRGLSFGSESKGSLELSGNGDGYGWDFGATFLATDFLTLGASWRQGPELKLHGKTSWNLPPPFQTGALGDKVNATIHSADFLRMGLAVTPIQGKLTISMDLERQYWSNLQALDIVFTDSTTKKQTVTASPKLSRDTWTFHGGVDFMVTDSFAVRAGYIYDQYTNPEVTVNPAPPDSNQQVYSVGLSYLAGEVAGIKNFGIHLYFEDVLFAKRTTTTSEFPGVYEGGFSGGTYAYLFGLSITGSFDTTSKSQFAAKAGGSEK